MEDKNNNEESSSHMSVFNESFSIYENGNSNENNNNNNYNEILNYNNNNYNNEILSNQIF